MRPARILVAAAVVVGATAALAIAPASAGKNPNSTVKFKNINPFKITGVVKSKIKLCKLKRTVVVKYKPPSARSALAAGAPKKIKLGKAKTNKKGKWKLKGDFFVGKYFAILKSKKLGKSALPTGRKEEDLEEEEADEEEDEANIAGGRGCDSDETRTRE